MASHPLAPSPLFSTALVLEKVGTAVQSASCIPFAITSSIGTLLPYTTLGLPLFYPSALVHRISGGDINLTNRFAWLSPTIGMPLLTLAGRVAFDATSSPLLRGLVHGVHTSAMCLLTNSPVSWSGMITLRQALGNAVGLPSAVAPLLDGERQLIVIMSEVAASAAFLTASLGLSFFGGFHVISANVLGHVAAAVTAVAVARLAAIPATRDPAYA